MFMNRLQVLDRKIKCDKQRRQDDQFGSIIKYSNCNRYLIRTKYTNTVRRSYEQLGFPLKCLIKRTKWTVRTMHTKIKKKPKK